MFEQFRVTAMGTPRSWTKVMFQDGQLPRYLAVFFLEDEDPVRSGSVYLRSTAALLGY